MLPAQSRVRQASDFRATIRGGVRAARPTLVVHARAIDDVVHARAIDDPVHAGMTQSVRAEAPQSPPSRVGFVVSKAVGNAVTRNRVKRRLRHLVLPLMADTPGMVVVVRALPAAATDPDRLPVDLAQAWSRCAERLGLGKDAESKGAS